MHIEDQAPRNSFVYFARLQVKLYIGIHNQSKSKTGEYQFIPHRPDDELALLFREANHPKLRTP